MPTHKKGHDKDKYYHLAKDQGYRSRAAFKLIQINKRFNFLNKARVLIDLCAAPGGWCQVAAKSMPQGSIVLGIDLLPIKTIRNVKTVVADITTAECRKAIVNELNGWKADVVLCDGAPNIGSAYDKDAYVQNELVLASLKTATDHLNAGGTFCTKVYRSRDYHAIVWVLQQLFEEVQTMKPNSSRSQSSEIFLVCLKYLSPSFVDPKLLDPNHVFKEVVDPGLKKVDIFHKKYDKSNLRHRTGYDESLGPLLKSTAPVSDFINSPEPIQLLTNLSELIFSPDCIHYKENSLTTDDIVRSCSDLRVLGKLDFKKLLKWRLKLRSEEDQQKRQLIQIQSKIEDPKDDEEIMLEEMERMRSQSMAQSKREKKQLRKEASKLRERAALGMNHNAFEETVDTELFTLNRSVDFDALDNEKDFVMNIENEKESEEFGESEVVVDKKGVRRAKNIIIDEDEDDLENQLNEDYQRFLVGKRSLLTKALSGREEGGGVDRTVSMKKMKNQISSSNLIAENEELDLNDDVNDEVVEPMEYSEENVSQKKKSSRVDHESLDRYVKVLSGAVDHEEKKSSKASNARHHVVSDGDSEGSDSDEEGVASHHNEASEKWFSHPIFRSSLIDDSNHREEDDADDVQEMGMGLMMPKTDREKRKEKRKKVVDRRERKKLKKQSSVEGESNEEEPSTRDRNRGEDEAEEGEVAARQMRKNKNPCQLDPDEMDQHMDQSYSVNIKKVKKNPVVYDKNDFEVVAMTHDSLSVVDDRKYDSDHEMYDDHDRAVTMAIATMMLRNSKRKEFVDASYNRYSWNDPQNLPDWFLDDEMRHNKPILPVPKALIDQIKGKDQNVGTKEIKKVAEARARKRKRATAQLRAAKKQASTLAESSELSEKQKLRAIERVMKSKKLDKASKVYVVTRKTKTGSSGTTMSDKKGKLKFVDKRMKKDARAMKKANKRKR